MTGFPVMHVWPIERVCPLPERREWITDEAIENAAEYLIRYGFATALIVDPLGSLIEGTIEYLAARRVGYDTVPVIVLSEVEGEGAMRVTALRKFFYDDKMREVGESFEVEDETEARHMREGGFIAYAPGEGIEKTDDPDDD